MKLASRVLEHLALDGPPYTAYLEGSSGDPLDLIYLPRITTWIETPRWGHPPLRYRKNRREGGALVYRLELPDEAS